jgi:hypothetical protein
MLEAESALIQMGNNAIPLLEALLNGEAKNDFGVPYRNLGLPLRCGLEAIIRLGEVAKPLEALLAAELAKGQAVAATALGSLRSLNQASIDVLANSLDGDLDLAYEAATALVHCNEADNELVLSKISESKHASSLLFKARTLVASKP